ncbi:unnamed protein product, partial [Nesidiocoris tenuis]
MRPGCRKLEGMRSRNSVEKTNPKDTADRKKSDVEEGRERSIRSKNSKHCSKIRQEEIPNRPPDPPGVDFPDSSDDDAVMDNRIVGQREPKICFPPRDLPAHLKELKEKFMNEGAPEPPKQGPAPKRCRKKMSNASRDRDPLTRSRKMCSKVGKRSLLVADGSANQNDVQDPEVKTQSLKKKAKNRKTQTNNAKLMDNAVQTIEPTADDVKTKICSKARNAEAESQKKQQQVAACSKQTAACSKQAQKADEESPQRKATECSKRADEKRSQISKSPKSHHSPPEVLEVDLLNTSSLSLINKNNVQHQSGHRRSTVGKSEMRDSCEHGAGDTCVFCFHVERKVSRKKCSKLKTDPRDDIYGMD